MVEDGLETGGGWPAPRASPPWASASALRGANAVGGDSARARLGRCASQLPEAGALTSLRRHHLRAPRHQRIRFTWFWPPSSRASWLAVSWLLVHHRERAAGLPTSILGTFIVMYIFGFTLNTYTVLGLTLNRGIVVDDAIMVLENIYRHREEGRPRCGPRRRRGR